MSTGAVLGPPQASPLPQLPAPSGTVASVAVHPLDLLKIMTPDDWERFTLEWALELENSYEKVENAAGSGDLGCDVVATKIGGGWDNYQCKRYGHPLAPGDAWLEFGKHIYYSFQGLFTPADAYYFVAPQGVGTTLASLLRNPTRLKAAIEMAWDKHCRSGITATTDVPLTGAFKTYFDTFNFGIFSYVTPSEMIKGHATSPYHSMRFPFALPARPAQAPVKAEIGNDESRYVEKVCAAYGENVGHPVDADSIPDKHKSHFSSVRRAYFSAEELRTLYSEAVPPGTFDHLKQEIFDAVEMTVVQSHPNGLSRLSSAVAQAQQAQITNSPLLPRLSTRDRHGVCHHLANDDLLTWVEP